FSSYSMFTLVLFCVLPRPPSSTPFPYTTLFRSEIAGIEPAMRAADEDVSPRLVGYLGHRVGKMDHVTLRGSAQLPSTATVEWSRSEEHTSELQSRENLVCRLLLEKKNT